MSRGDTVQTAFVLRGPEQVVWLNRESSPIHETNDDESLHLTDDTVEPYLRFFLMFLRGDSAVFALNRISGNNCSSTGMTRKVPASLSTSCAVM